MSFTPLHRTLGRVAAWSVFALIVVYAVTTILGVLSLNRLKIQSVIHTSPLWNCS
jgi:hypothetical protein